MPVTEGGAEQRYYDAFAMVMADGLVSSKERLLLNGQADALGLSPADIERIERRFHDKDSDPAPASDP